MVPWGASLHCVKGLLAGALRRKLRDETDRMLFSSSHRKSLLSLYSLRPFHSFSLTLTDLLLVPHPNSQNAGKKPAPASALEVEKDAAPPKGTAAGKNGAVSTAAAAAAEANEAPSTSASAAAGAATTAAVLPATYLQLARDFALLGWTAFGGPSAHVAQFILLFTEKGKRKWLTTSVFAELFALAQCVPGPSSTQLAYG